MTPQLFINYKLKSATHASAPSYWTAAIHSATHCILPAIEPPNPLRHGCTAHTTLCTGVAHLPWKVFMYKAFNTFIDDVFSWMLEMPTRHRIACLRDDLVFFIILYQRYCYPVDKTRTNEFGRAYEKEGQAGDGTETAEGAEAEAAVDEAEAAAAEHGGPPAALENASATSAAVAGFGEATAAGTKGA